MTDDLADDALGPDDVVVVLEISGRIASINRPDKRNALSSDVLAKVPVAMLRAEGDPDVDVIVLTGADPAFSAGLDLHELGSTVAIETHVRLIEEPPTRRRSVRVRRGTLSSDLDAPDGAR